MRVHYKTRSNIPIRRVLEDTMILNMRQETAKRDRVCSFCRHTIKAGNVCWRSQEWGTVYYRQFCVLCGLKRLEQQKQEIETILKPYKFKEKKNANQSCQSKNIHHPCGL